MAQQGLESEVKELSGMINILKAPIRSHHNLSQSQLEGVIEEAQALIAKLLTYGAA